MPYRPDLASVFESWDGAAFSRQRSHSPNHVVRLALSLGFISVFVGLIHAKEGGLAPKALSHLMIFPEFGYGGAVAACAAARQKLLSLRIVDRPAALGLQAPFFDTMLRRTSKMFITQPKRASKILII